MREHPGRKGHPRELRERAAVLRRAGASQTKIARALDIGYTTVGRWMREDGVAAPRTVASGQYDAQLEAVRERWEGQQREQDVHRDAVGVLSDRELQLVGASIYWAEGAKTKPWRRAHRLTFMNSDASMIRVFLAYLDLVGVQRHLISCRVQIHEDADMAAATAYWQGVVGEGVQWHRTALKKHNPKPVRHNLGEAYRGCLCIDVRRSAGEYRRAAGTWEGVAEAMNAVRSPVV